MGQILITGGAGYIGSHTIIELVAAGFEKIISVDNYSNSNPDNYNRIEKICGLKPEIIQLDLTDKKSVEELFGNHQIDAVIHFAALKSVPDSLAKPNLYYDNNLNSLINVLNTMEKFGVNKFIFSSSCSIYGNPKNLPVTEKNIFGKAESPYARTKQMGEDIIADFSKANEKFQSVSLRYFNPAGAHPSSLIGEALSNKPDNLIPLITQAAAGLRDKITVFGSDYNTKDGSCIRDYIHVCDIAKAHVKALQKIFDKSIPFRNQVINLGSGIGTSVLEMITSFEKVNNVKVPYVIGKRRNGDVESIYANNEYAKEVLGWVAEYKLSDMLSTAWNWQKTNFTQIK